MYKIKFSYNTGNSFGTEKNIIEEISLPWENISIARENLRRIKEHYQYYQELHDWHVRNNNTHDAIVKKYKDKPWFCKDNYQYDLDSERSLILLTDENKDYKLQVVWVGYFESLNWAEIVPDSSEDRIEFN